MNRNRIILAVLAVVVLVLSSILLLGNTPAHAGKGEICATPTYHFALGAPRKSFQEVYEQKGDRRTFSSRGQLIVVKNETRAFKVCGKNLVYSFTKVDDSRVPNDGVWTFSG